MAIQQQKISALLASNVSTMVSSQNKSKTPVSQFFTNINHQSYNKQLVWNRFALHTAGRYSYKENNMNKLKRFFEIVTLSAVCALCIQGCVQHDRSTSPPKQPAVGKDTWTNHCGKAITNSCSDLAIFIDNSSNKNYSFIATQGDTHGTITTGITSPIKASGTGQSTLGQTTYGPKGSITLTNATDNISLQVNYQQNYCSSESGTITKSDQKNSGASTIGLTCSEYEGDYGYNHSGCVVCTIDTPEYNAASIQAKYVGENVGCPWQNGPNNAYQVCPPYVDYFDRDSRMLQVLNVKADGLLYNASGKPFDTTYAPVVHSGQAAIFVMGFDGQIYASNNFAVGLFHHSAFFAGGDVAAAGELYVSKGKITKMTNCSGHYLPSNSITKQAIASLTAQGYDNSFPYVSCSTMNLIRDLDYKKTDGSDH
jgi:hypothetical protein